jgi:uncharacterized repeat protein (TIGR03803 family)
MQRRLTNLLLLSALLAGPCPILGGRLTAQTFATLYNFSGGADGSQPFAGLTLSGYTLYGATLLAGNSGDGTIFALNIDGSGFKALYNFSGFNDGFYAQGTPTVAGGVVYGTAHFGGAANNGTLFTLNADGTGFTILHTFSAGSGSPPNQINSDGANPQAGLVLAAGTLYGTAVYGGSGGYGTVFAINADGVAFNTLHSFTAPSSVAETNADGANPYGGLVLSGSTLYGTAHFGGTSGHGTVFAINADSSGFKTLHSFSSTNDGGAPFAGLVLSSNRLFGTALQGGTSGQGTLFALNSDGTAFTVLHAFSGTVDGANPAADLILSGTTLYGTTSYGGTFNNGTVFRLQTDGTGFTNLYSFSATSSSAATNSDGANPYGRLTLAANSLYGTTKAGGSFGQGTVFSISVGPISAPSLALTLSGTNVILTWPSLDFTFRLESTTNLASPAGWTTVSPPPVLVSDQNTVTNPLAGNHQFYRLIQ